MNRSASRPMHLFLTEMMLVIFFFAVSATVCARLFVRSHTLRKESEELTRAVMEAQTAAELFYAYDADVEAIKDKVSADVVFDVVKDNDTVHGFIRVTDGEETLFEVEVRR